MRVSSRLQQRTHYCPVAWCATNRCLLFLLQHVNCSDNAISSLAPLQHLPLLLSVDTSNNQLSEVLGKGSCQPRGLVTITFDSWYGF